MSSLVQVSVCDFSPEEQRNFQTYKTQIDPQNERTERQLLRYFLLAKKDPTTALSYAQTFFKVWEEVESKAPEGMENVIKEVETNKIRFGGFDEEGRRIIHFYYGLHDPTAFTAHNTLKTFFILMDIALRDSSTVLNGFIMVCWMKDSGWRNFDLASEKFYSEAIYQLEPMSMQIFHSLLLVDSPWYVWAAMKLCQPFITQELRSKLLTFSLEDLQKRFNPKQVLENNYFLEQISDPFYRPFE